MTGQSGYHPLQETLITPGHSVASGAVHRPREKSLTRGDLGEHRIGHLHRAPSSGPERQQSRKWDPREQHWQSRRRGAVFYPVSKLAVFVYCGLI